MHPILNYLTENAGIGTEVEVPEQLFEKHVDESLHITSRTIVKYTIPEGKSYRDDRRFKSVHLSDYREVTTEGFEHPDIVAHIELFNPEYHPILHMLFDIPNWFFQNMLKDR